MNTIAPEDTRREVCPDCHQLAALDPHYGLCEECEDVEHLRQLGLAMGMYWRPPEPPRHLRIVGDAA